jgi:hypothetical protein
MQHPTRAKRGLLPTAETYSGSRGARKRGLR